VRRRPRRAIIKRMAVIKVEGDELLVQLSWLEKIGALLSGVRVPLSSITGARMTETPYAELRGIRVGTGIPFVIVLGRMWFGKGSDFVAIYGTGRTVVIDLTEDAPFKRLLVSVPDDRVIEDLKRAGIPASPKPPSA